MSPELAYFLKVNIAIAFFYAFYRLFFYKDTFFKWRRATLLCFLAISALYPLLNIQEWVKEQEPMVAMADMYSTIILPEITVVTSSDINWKQLIVSSLNYIYLGVISILCLRFLIQLFGIIRVRMQTPTIILKDTRIHLLDKPEGPFSFFKWIFIHPQSHTEEELEEILTHEKTHARQWHSVDVILSELTCIICWFNPFMWLLKREIRNNLEFLADHKVLETGHDCKTYQYHLLGLTYEKKVTTLYNSFNVLPLKIRIRMMNKKRTKRIERTKYLLFLPLAALLLIVSNIEAIARSTEKIMNPATETDAILMDDLQLPETLFEERSLNVPADTVVFEVVEQMPQYPGGQKALMKFLAENIKYPSEAAKNNIQGRVIAQFIVDKEGNVTFPKIVRSVNPELDNEALRVVKAMPKWIPGTQRGEKVAVRYTVPVMFRLPGKTDSNPIDDFKPVTVNGETIYGLAENMPEFPGGVKALMDYISSNVKYPADAKSLKIQGRVVVQFVVFKDGSIKYPQIVRSVNTSLDQEAIRVVNSMPNWKPGKIRGEDVSVKYTVPITFDLSKENL